MDPPGILGGTMAAKFRARDDLLTLQAAADYTGLSRRTLKRLADRGRVAYETLNDGTVRPWRRFRRSVLDGLLVKHGGAA